MEQWLYSLFIVGESWCFWRLRAVEVRVEDVETVETHFRMGHCPIASMAVGQVRVVLTHPSTHLGGGRVMIVGRRSWIVRAVARRWRRAGRLLFLGPATSRRHDRRLTFTTPYFSLSAQRIPLRTLHFGTLFAILCVSPHRVSLSFCHNVVESIQREKKRTKNLLTPSPFLVKPTPCQQYRATIKEKEAALPNIFQCAPQKKTEKNNEIALKLDCSSYTYCGLWSSGVSWRPSYTIVHQLICLCCHTITDVRAIKSKDTRGDCRQSNESLNRWNMKLSDVFLVVVLFTCSASGNRFETPINL